MSDRLVRHLANYAAYHRDRRNVATHVIGIPMILLGLAILLSRPVWMAGELPLSPAVGVLGMSAVFYLRLDRQLGVGMIAILFGVAVAGAAVAALDFGAWLWTGVGFFVVGWIFQGVGHLWEGRKPAFFEDIVGLLIGPIYLLAELVFALGLRRDLHGLVQGEIARITAMQAT